MLQNAAGTCLLYCACHAKCIFAYPLQMSHACHRFWKCYKNPHVLLTFDKVHNPLRLPRKTTSERPKVLRTRPFFFTFDFEMCFGPQPRTLFRHVNFHSGPSMVCFDVFCTFWRGNALRATAAYTFSASQLPKVVRRWCVLYILSWTFALLRNGVQLFISHLTTWLRTRRFSEPTFRPSRATNHWKNTANCDFSRTCIFFLLTLSLLWSSLFCPSLLWLFPPLLFHLSILSEVWLLNFLR